MLTLRTLNSDRSADIPVVSDQTTSPHPRSNDNHVTCLLHPEHRFQPHLRIVVPTIGTM